MYSSENEVDSKYRFMNGVTTYILINKSCLCIVYIVYVYGQLRILNFIKCIYIYIYTILFILYVFTTC